MNLAWAVRILGDGGQEGRRVAPSKTGPFAARQEGLINTFQQLTAGDEDPPNGDKSLAGVPSTRSACLGTPNRGILCTQYTVAFSGCAV